MQLSNEQLDVLKEVGNIGAGNAATALSQLLDQTITISVPQVKLMSLNNFPEEGLLPITDNLSIAVAHRILGKLKGGMLLLFPHNSALAMIDILSSRGIGSTEVFSMIDESALKESSHIICCSYLNAIGQFLNLYQLIPSIAETSIAQINKLTRVLAKRFLSENADYVLPIENRLKVEDIELNLFLIAHYTPVP